MLPWCNSVTLYNVTLVHKFFYRINILKIRLLDYVILLLLMCTPSLVLIGCYLPFDSQADFLCVSLKLINLKDKHFMMR